MLVEKCYNSVPCSPSCMNQCKACYIPCYWCSPVITHYIIFPLTAPIACWPCLGPLSVLDGIIRFLVYLPIAMCLLLYGLVLRSHGKWLAGLTTLREGSLLCCGACTICFCPCTLFCSLYLDPDGEEAARVEPILSCIGNIDGRRFYYLHWWPESNGFSQPLGHPRWAWLGKFLSKEYHYDIMTTENAILLNHTEDHSSCAEVSNWGLCYTCGFSKLALQPDFPCGDEDNDPLSNWRALKRDNMDMFFK
jgi:hypothetical protein